MTTPEHAPEITIQPKTKLTGTVVKTTLAGALLDVGQPLPGVIHISQLRKEPVNKVEDVLQIGQSVDVWVRRVKADRIELTMIEPLAQEWTDLKPEMVVKGKVVRVETYGAFVDIGAERPGLVHVSEMAVGYVKNPSEVVKEGDEVEAVVLEVNRRKKQIRLSMKALQAEALAEEPAREDRRGRGRKKDRASDYVEEPAAPAEPELTAMEIAFREAQERAKERDKSAKAKPAKAGSGEQDEIQRRTLENRVTSN